MMMDDLIGKCPITTAQKVIGGKWSLLIMYHLKEKTLRFNELLRLFDGVTHATLTKQLKNLEQYGLVDRKVYSQIPPKVEYSLSEIGVKFQPVIDSLFDWGNIYIQYLNDTRQVDDSSPFHPTT